MVKINENLKYDLDERQLEEAIPSLLREIPFLHVGEVQKVGVVGSRANFRSDLLIKVTSGKREWSLVGEFKACRYPNEVRVGVARLKEQLQRLDEKQVYGVLIAPYLSEQSASICTAAGVGYVDLAGNARLCFDQIFIKTVGAGNPFRDKRNIRALFSPKCTRVLRTLLQGPLIPWKVLDLAKKSNVSLGIVSNVRTQLLAQEWAVQEEGGIRVNHPEVVLDAWAKADDWERRTTVRSYSILVADQEEVATKLHDLLGDVPHAFTQWFGAGLRHPLATAPLVTAYVTEFPDEKILAERLLARRVDGIGRLRLVVPNDVGVLSPIQTLSGFPVVSDVQLYLDLLHAGLRGDEAANELLSWKDFSNWS